MPFADRKYAAWRLQGRLAKQRGIVWCFTYRQWFAWWEDKLGPDWFEKRGNKTGQYCMARKGDKGPYAAWNVRCQLAEENCRDRAVNGVHAFGIRHGRTKLTEQQVLAAFNSSASAGSIARKYGVDPTTIWKIKIGLNWSHLTGARR